MPWTGAPLGSTPLGVGEPEAAPAPPFPTLFSKYINPGTKDYVFDPVTGGLAQMPGTRQRVLLALLTFKGSSTVLQDFGIRPGGRLDRTHANRIRADVRIALRHIIADGSMRLNRVDVEKRDLGRVTVTVHYDDLALSEPEQTQDIVI